MVRIKGCFDWRGSKSRVLGVRSEWEWKFCGECVFTKKTESDEHVFYTN